MTTNLPTLVLFPGIGADATAFEPQRAVRANLVVPKWVDPVPGETLAAYAGRLAGQVPGADRLFVGGTSFGGMIAQEVARLVCPRAVVLIASCRSAGGVGASLWFAPLAAAVPRFVYRAMPHLPARRGAFGRVPPRLMQWGPGAIARWPGAGEMPCPVHHIHGARDRTMPLRKQSPPPDVVVPGAGHLVNLTHPDAVNRFLEERMREG